MSRTSRGALARTVVTLLGAALALHELRYASWLCAHGGHASGHSIDGLLSTVAPVVTVLLTIVAAAALVACGRARGGEAARRRRVRVSWPIASGALLAIFSWQELLQGALQPDHPFGLHGAFGHGGWIVVPLALLLGGIVALMIGVARELERRCSWARVEFVWGRVAPVAAVPVVAIARTRPLADNRAGRSPPSLVV